MFVELGAAITLTGATLCELIANDNVVLSSDTIRLADVVICDRELVEIGDLAIAALPRDATRIQLSREAVADLVRRRVPGLADLETPDGQSAITFQRTNTPAEDPPQLQCFAAARSFASGELVTAADVREASCATDQPKARLAYDRQQGVVRATQQVADGDYLGRLMPLSAAGWDQDQALTLRIQTGAVTIEREVRSAEPGSDKGRVFVTDSEGIVFQAPADMLKKQEVSHE